MPASGPDRLRVGAAVANITPPVGVELSGGAFGPSKGVLYPLEAKALLLERAEVLPHSFLVSQANGSVGYLPSRAAYGKESHEAAACPRYVGLCSFDPSVGEIVRDGCLALLRELADDPARPAQ